ncbi:MAG: hypothetical protein OK438_00710 [Thaumarchaeota archaeon]|nr:hypothetical protein [Nitrososphaerota archaeon]
MKPTLTLCLLLVTCMFLVVPSQGVHAQQSSLAVTYEADLSQHFGLYSGTIHGLKLTVSGVIQQTNASAHVSIYYQFNLKSVSGLPSGANYSIISISQHPVLNDLYITLPPGTSGFEFSVYATIHDQSVLYRGTATLTYASVAMDVPPYSPTSYVVLVPTSPSFEILSVFPGSGPNVVTQDISINGTSYLQTGFVSGVYEYVPGTIVILYQAAYFKYFLVAYVVLAAGLLAAAGLVLRRLRQQSGSLLVRVRRLLRWLVTSIDSRKLLASLVGVAILMVSIAFIFGPPPSPRLYLAATPQTAQTLGPAINGTGFTYLTPTQASDEFDRLSQFGFFHSVLVADYQIRLPSQGLGSDYRILVLSQYANATYIRELKSLYSPWVSVANNTLEMTRALDGQRVNYGSNHLGLGFFPQGYAAISNIEGLLSLVVPFLALAFFARFMIESASKGLGRLAQAVAFSFFLFLFGELVYIQTAVLLGIPVALHATISPLETAGGGLGFGGGSRPRLVMGIVGFLFGASFGPGGRIKFDRVVFIGLASAFVFLIVDPLQIGQDFYQLILLGLTSETGTTFGQSALVTVRDSVSHVMSIFGDFSTLSYFAQHGAVFFFVGAVPFALYTYIRKSSATLLLFFSALLSGLGYVRIGDQDPLKAIASTMPGVTIGILVILAFLSLDRVERFLRLRLGIP